MKTLVDVIKVERQLEFAQQFHNHYPLLFPVRGIKQAEKNVPSVPNGSIPILVPYVHSVSMTIDYLLEILRPRWKTIGHWNADEKNISYEPGRIKLAWELIEFRANLPNHAYSGAHAAILAALLYFPSIGSLLGTCFVPGISTRGLGQKIWTHPWLRVQGDLLYLGRCGKRPGKETKETFPILIT